MSTQTESIKKYAENNGLELTEIYRDEGISGGSIDKRHGLQKCLRDGQQGKFKILIVHRLSRFGRNARELLENNEILKKHGIDLFSISENIDFSNKYGTAMLGMFAVMAELERDIITEQLSENMIAMAKKGIPVGGKMPVAREFDRKEMKWNLKEKEAGLLQWAADQYLKGKSMQSLSRELRAQGMKMTYKNLVQTLTEKCGDTYTIKFKNEDPIVFKIPRILSDDTMKKIKERMAFNTRNNRTDLPRKYLLSGFIRCQHCMVNLKAQTQKYKGKDKYQYYRHLEPEEENGCFAFTRIPMQAMDKAVFETIFENFVDVPSFERAISDSLPDEDKANNLKDEIARHKKELKQVERDLEKLIDLAMEGTLNKETIKNRELELLQSQSSISEALEQAQSKFDDMPDIDQTKKDAEEIRLLLLEKYGGKDRFEGMTFDEKRRLLHWLFDGKDDDGKPYGIYVSVSGNGKNLKYNYFLYGRITGVRTLKGDDINYMDWDEDEGEQSEEASPKSPTAKTDKFYNTKNVGVSQIP